MRDCYDDGSTSPLFVSFAPPIEFELDVCTTPTTKVLSVFMSAGFFQAIQK